MNVPTREEILEKETYKKPGVDVLRRVFYTLMEDTKGQPDRTTKAVALLVEFLSDKGIMGLSEVDDFLFTCVMGSPSLSKSKPAAKPARRKGK